jgi:hypothetical protein
MLRFTLIVEVIIYSSTLALFIYSSTSLEFDDNLSVFVCVNF